MTHGKKMLTIVCGAIALLCAVYLLFYFGRAQSARQTLHALASMKAEPLTSASISDNGILKEYVLLHERNGDLVGWLSIDGTDIDYPVMQTQDNDYYLHRDFDGEYAFHGLPFMDAACDMQNGATCYFIYGHNMRDGTMFGSLKAYLDEEYYLAHKTIAFDTLYERGTYEILSVFLSEVYTPESDVFKYYQYTTLPDEDAFNHYVEQVAALSIYDAGVEAAWGDTLLTLSTCSRHAENGRLAIVAKKI